MSADGWAEIAERGTAGAIRLGAWIHRRFGRGPTLALLWIAAAYFQVSNAHARRGSRQYLERLWASPEGRAALGRRPGPATVLRHIHEFAVSLYDRMLVWGGALDAMQVEHDGSEAIFDLARAGRGALLLGAHLGSLDMLWFLSQRYRLVVNVVAFQANAQRINAFFESLSPGGAVRVIDLDPASVRAAFQIRACIERGEFVVILADRAAPGKATRTARAPFLGRAARFPLGPFLLAGALGCPVLLALCPRIGTARYRTLLRPLGEARRVPRTEREKRARELLGAYLAQLEAQCLRHPYQWFNFYEFWAPEGGAAS